MRLFERILASLIAHVHPIGMQRFGVDDTQPEQHVTVLLRDVTADDAISTPIYPSATTEAVSVTTQTASKPSGYDLMIAAGAARWEATEPIPRMPRKADRQVRQMAREIATETRNDIPVPGEFIAHFDRLSLMPTLNQDEGAWLGWHAHAIAQARLIHVSMPKSIRQDIARCIVNHVPTVALFHVHGPAAWERYHQTVILDHLAAVLSSATCLTVTPDHLASVWTPTENVNEHGWEVVLSVDEEGIMA